jgi:hypothetical protein
LIRERVRGERGRAFDRREDRDDRIAAPRARARDVGKTAPNVDERLPARVHHEPRAELSGIVEARREGVANAGEIRIAAPVDDRRHAPMFGSRARAAARRHFVPGARGAFRHADSLEIFG